VTVVVDASVALKWYVAEADSAAARILFVGEQDVIAPELLVAEISNASWKLLRRGEIDRTQHVRIAEEIGGMLSRLVPLHRLVARAAVLAHDLDHPVYDCFYLALSEAENAPLITADRRLIARVARTPFATTIRRLSAVAARR
jgi:predicted nucleic acid-binding protein